MTTTGDDQRRARPRTPRRPADRSSATTRRPSSRAGRRAGTSSASTHGPDGRLAAAVLPADDVPVPVGRPAHRPLVHQDPDRRDRPLPPDARRQRVPADRLRRVRAAGRERGDQEPASTRATGRWRTSTTMRRQLRTMGADVRLDRRGRHLPTPTTTAGTSGCSCSSSRPGLAYRAKSAGRLVPQRRDARARAGRGRRPPLLALRREGREARPRPVVPADVTNYADELLDFCGHRLAGAGPDHADELDRPVDGRGDRVRDGAVAAPRRAARSCASSRPARTRCSARRSWSSRPSTRWSRADRARPARPRSRRTSPRPRPKTEIDRLSTDREKTGVADRRRRDQPGQRRADPDLHRRLRAGQLRHRRDHGRPGPRRARLRVRAEVRPADPCASSLRRATTTADADARRGATSPHAADEVADQQRAAFSGLPAGRGRRGDDRRLARRSAGKGKAAVTYRLRDWLISRQRYWGTPIPVIYCDVDGIVPVPEEDLPVLLPDTVDYRGSGENPLNRDEAFLNVDVPAVRRARRGARPTRWTRSSTRPGTGSATCRRTRPTAPVDADLVERWTPVDQYTGGAEHAVMHLLYSRVLHQGDARPRPGRPRASRSAAVQPGPDPGRRRRADVQVAAATSRTPTSWSRRYGADTVRLFLMFMGPWDQGGPWSPTRHRRRGTSSSTASGRSRSTRTAASRATRRRASCPRARTRRRADRIRAAAHRTLRDVTEDYRGVPLEHDGREAHGADERADALPRARRSPGCPSGTRRSGCCC